MIKERFSGRTARFRSAPAAASRAPRRSSPFDARTATHAGTAPLATQAIEMLRAFARRQAETVTAWVRVGYVQGNMNSDNCLLSGRTMDYGPFGFVEEYSELWTPFTSDMEAKFGFERQPLAAQVQRRASTAP